MTNGQTAVHVMRRDEATSLWRYVRDARPLVIFTAPVIYLCAIPFALLDLFVTLYQAVCFPVNGIPKVRRRDYLIFDRDRLPYLNAIEKFGCMYCSYANGLLAYVAEIAARTEQHFCPIKHHDTVNRPHSRYSHFLPYGDGRAFQRSFNNVRNDFVDIKPAPQNISNTK